jgi:phospholipid-binding lipoprotein MlaA
MHRFRIRTVVRGSLILLLLLGSGCATTGGAADPRDPIEGFNRSMYSFNEFMDQHLFDPLGRAWQAALPDFLDRGISNVFSNLGDVAVIANDILQGKLGQAVQDIARVVFNTTIGIGGFFDVSSHIGLPKHDEDLGQTLGRWGVGPGPYLVAPFFGPMTLRDAAGFGVQSTFLYPVSYVGNDAYRAGLMSLNYVDYKADLLSADRILGEAALDEYEFVKNAYLDRRQNQIEDRAFGAEPGEEFE